MSAGNLTYLLIPVDPKTNEPIIDMACLVPSESELLLFSKDLEALGFRYVSLPAITLYNLCEFRELWKEHLTNLMLSKLTSKKEE